MLKPRPRFAGVPIVLGCALLAPAGVSGQGFEGVIQQQVRTAMPQAVAPLAGAGAADPGKVLDAVAGRLAAAPAPLVTRQQMTITVKGAKMRVDGARGTSPGSYSILDAGTGTMYTVMPAQKQVMVATARDVTALQKAMQQQMGLPAPSTAAPKRTALGTKALLGVRARGYRLVSADGAAVVWIDPALGPGLARFNSMQSQMAAGASALQNAVRQLGFPLQSQLVVKAPPMLGPGWMYNESTITAVQRHPVPDSTFALPAGFKQVRLGAGRAPAR